MFNLQISAQNALLIIQLITLLITITGWIYTGSQQRSILRESRKYQRRDRDIAVYRTRMEKASELTKSLIETSDKWYKLAAFAKAILDEDKTQEFPSLALPLIKDVAYSRSELAIILYDPQFRTLRDLLQPQIGKKLYDSLKTSSEHITAFHAKFYDLLPADSDIADKVNSIYEQGKEVGDELVSVADGFADAFAVLDKELTDEA